MQQSDASQATKTVRYQAIATLIMVGAGLLVGDSLALSVLVGAGISTVATAGFAYWVFRQYRASDPGLLVMRFYGAEVAKITLILVSFSAAVRFLPGLNVPAMLGAYFVAQVFPAMLASESGASRTREK